MPKSKASHQIGGIYQPWNNWSKVGLTYIIYFIKRYVSESERREDSDTKLKEKNLYGLTKSNEKKLYYIPFIKDFNGIPLEWKNPAKLKDPTQ